MTASLETQEIPCRPNIVIKTVDREIVRAIVNAERALCRRANELGLDVDEVHRGYAPYVEGLMHPLSEDEKQNFQRLLVEETLNDQELVKAQGAAADAERKYAEVLKQPTPPSTGRVFMAGVNVTILIGLALFWAFK